MRRSYFLKLYGIIVLIVTPFVALANAGSPIVWFNILHLVFANFFIGALESKILLRFNLPNRMWLVIVSNYISAIIGSIFILFSFVKTYYGRDIGSDNSIELLQGFALTFLASLIIEYPFVLLSLQEKKQRRLLWKPFFIANLVSNVVMVCLYFGVILLQGY